MRRTAIGSGLQRLERRVGGRPALYVLLLVIVAAIVAGLLVWAQNREVGETWKDAGRFLRDRQRMAPKPR